MGKEAKRSATLLIFFGIVFIIGISAASFFGIRTNRNYIKNGEKTVCVVTDIVNGRKGKQSARAKYQSKDGRTVYADLVANRRVSIDEQLTAYVLPDDPEKLYCPPEMPALILIFGVAGFMLVIGFVMFIVGISELRKHNILFKNGIPTKGEILSFWAEGKTGHNANVRFFDSDRNERVIDMFMKNKPAVGDKVNIVYCIKPNGKIVSDIIEF